MGVKLGLSPTGSHRLTVFEHREQRRICQPKEEEEKECRRKEHNK